MQPTIYLVIVIVSFLSAWGLTHWAIALSTRHDAFDLPGPRKIHQTKVPNLGWVGIFGGWLVPLGLLALVVCAMQRWGYTRNPIFAGMLRKMPTMAGIVAGGVLSLFFGWLDDRRKMSPLWKLLVQTGLGSLLCALGIRITLFSSHWLSAPLTIAWVLCVMNAFNLLDNLDGTCAGVAMIGCFLFLCVAAWLKQYLICLLLAGFLGSLGGFLLLNFPPARIFMGNAGSSFVGYIMVTLTILETFYKRGVPSHLAVITPVLILAVPIYDTTCVVLIRVYHRLPVYRGDTNHFAHRLLERGLTSPQTVLAIYGITLVVGMGSLFLPLVQTLPAILILAACCGFLVGLGVWEFYLQRRRMD